MMGESRGIRYLARVRRADRMRFGSLSAPAELQSHRHRGAGILSVIHSTKHTDCASGRALVTSMGGASPA
jgi:hypothetical protein